MADLGNSKIKDTYTLVLQTDASGNLQNLDGTTPSPFIFNSGFTYNVGTLVDGYVLTSDGSGNATWAAGGGTSYWSANTDGSISPSGGTGVVVSGDITTTLSGDVITQDLRLGNTDSGVHGFGGSIRPVTINDPITFRNADDGSADWLTLKPDEFEFYIAGVEEVSITTGGTLINVSSRDRAFQVLSTEGLMHIETSSLYNAITIGQRGSTAIGGADPRWATTNGYGNTAPNRTLLVNGITFIKSGSSSYNSWSADTTALQVSGNTHISGDISGATDLYLGSSTQTASTISAQESLVIKGRGVDNDFMTLRQDAIDLYIDASQYMVLKTGGITFNASGQDYDFDIVGADTTPIFQLYGESGHNRIRIRDHLAIGNNDAISHADSVFWGLAVTGSSLFYSGGTSISGNAITAVGNISGTTDLYIDGNIYSATTNLLDVFSPIANIPNSALANSSVSYGGI